MHTIRPRAFPIALAGGAVLIVQGVVAAFTRQNASYAGSAGDVLADGLLAAGLVLTLAGLDALRRGGGRRFGALAMAGQAAIVVAIVATMAVGRDVLDGVYVAGAAAWIVGQIAVAAAIVRHGPASARVALALPLASVAALALSDSGGAILLGLAWVALAVRQTGQPDLAASSRSGAHSSSLAGPGAQAAPNGPGGTA